MALVARAVGFTAGRIGTLSAARRWVAASPSPVADGDDSGGDSFAGRKRPRLYETATVAALEGNGTFRGRCRLNARNLSERIIPRGVEKPTKWGHRAAVLRDSWMRPLTVRQDQTPDFEKASTANSPPGTPDEGPRGQPHPPQYCGGRFVQEGALWERAPASRQKTIPRAVGRR